MQLRVLCKEGGHVPKWIRAFRRDQVVHGLSQRLQRRHFGDQRALLVHQLFPALHRLLRVL